MEPYIFTFSEFLNWIADKPIILLWAFFCLSNFLENVFPPWPGDTVTVFGGFLLVYTRDSGFDLFHLVSSTLIGNLLGAWSMYSFGGRFLSFLQKHPKIPFHSELTDEAQLQKTKQWFSRYGVGVVILSRFSAGIRFFVAIVAGMTRMNLLLFFVSFTVSVVLWCGILIIGGLSLGENWEKVIGFLILYNRIVGIALLLAFLFFFLIHRRKKK